MTNPYASPLAVGDFASRAAQEIHSVVRTFRILAIFSIAEALVTCISFVQMLVTMDADFLANLMIVGIHVAMIAFSLVYLRIAARMARRDLTVAKWARRLSLLMTLSFPLFPVGVFCLPIFSIAGVLCYRKVNRYYSEYCQVSEQ